MQDFINKIIPEASKYLKLVYDMKIMPYIVAFMMFAFILVVAIVVKPGKQINNVYVKVNNRLIQQKKRFSFDYEKVKSKLSKSGMLFKHPWLESPAAYIGVKMILMILVGALCGFLHPVLIIPGAILGYKLFDIYMWLSNNSDNKKMQKDIELIYNLLSIQVRSGVYLPNALCECADVIDPSDTRLKTSLVRLSGNILIGTPFPQSIKQLQDDFDNPHIDSLSVILLQAMESGHVEDVLADIGKQVKIFSALQMEKKKQEMDLSMTIVILGLFVDIMMVILSLSINTIMVEMTNF